jgi:pimeloyl-ACP methyl ester carboxylesterase
MSEIRHTFAEIEGPIGPEGRIRLHVAEAGPPSGKLLVLLHGFPDHWASWRGQVDTLARAGYRLVMPDMRGYGKSDKPRGVQAYSERMLASDVVGLIRWAGRESAIVVGHDWGGAAAWRTAIRYPEAVEKLIILNCAHPTAMRKKIFSDPRQLVRSWYMFFFQLPAIPEKILGFGHFSRLASKIVSTSRKGAFSEQTLKELRESWAEPGAIEAMLNYYRAAFRPGKTGIAQTPGSRVRVPTSIIWGLRDPHLGPALLDESAAYCEQVEIERLPEATHWLQYEEPAKVASLILAAAGRGSKAGVESA